MFRFTIRGVLWLTVVVALGLGWWIDRRELDRRFQVEERLPYELYNEQVSHPASLDEWRVWRASLHARGSLYPVMPPPPRRP